RDKAAQHGVSAGAVHDLVETALGGKLATTTVEGRERHPVRVRYARAWREDEESVRNLLLPVDGVHGVSRVEQDAAKEQTTSLLLSSNLERRYLPLSEVADVRLIEGPATIKSENGLLRNYVRLNVRGRGA